MKGDDEDDEDNSAIGVARYPCMPSLVALQQMRNRLHLAHVGRKLMKWTAMATGRELRKIAGEILEQYEDFGQVTADSYMLLARARYFYPNLNQMVLTNAPQFPKEASVTVETTTKSITGCRVLVFGVLNNNIDNYEHLAIEKGGQAVADAKKFWLELVTRMVLILQLRTSFEMADLSHRGATKKQNVLGKVIVPRLNQTIAYILSELEEKEREETFRLKRVKQKKIIKAQQANAEAREKTKIMTEVTDEKKFIHPQVEKPVKIEDTTKHPEGVEEELNMPEESKKIEQLKEDAKILEGLVKESQMNQHASLTNVDSDIGKTVDNSVCIKTCNEAVAKILEQISTQDLSAESILKLLGEGRLSKVDEMSIKDVNNFSNVGISRNIASKSTDSRV